MQAAGYHGKKTLDWDKQLHHDTLGFHHVSLLGRYYVVIK